jgi:hypothetical protein
MSYTEYGDDFTRRAPEGWSEALGHATDDLRMVPKEIYECPDELVRVFVVASEIHHAGSLKLHHKEKLAQVINDLERAVSRKRR